MPKISLPLPTDPVQSARVIGLKYVSAGGPGISRRKAGRGFVFVGINGKPVRDTEELRRIRSLAIPPAWTDVWICPMPDGHLQAIGRDARKRKQYRYHAAYRQLRDSTKFYRMLRFGDALPGIRRCIARDLELPGLPKEKVLATIVRLLERTLIRVGNVEYVKENHSRGLTTLQDRHVQIEGPTLRFYFKGKSGLRHEIKLEAPRLARIIRRCRDIPGHELFQYVDADGEYYPVDSGDVNQYLKEITGEDFTAKDFRTWHGTVLALSRLLECGRARSATHGKKNCVDAVKQVAERLGNRPATCKKYYIHPLVADAYMDGSLFYIAEEARGRRVPENGLSREELTVMELLKRSAAHQAKQIVSELKSQAA